jgi:spore maturation protein CgeB
MSRVALFCHSLRSDWNHGNAHFLRGVVSELQRRGFDVTAFEPENSWSARNLVADLGPAALAAWRAAYPDISLTTYEPARFDLDRALDGADLVLVHEWTDPALVARLAARRRAGARHLLLFHDTHHRMVSAPAEMARLDLDGFDAVLAFGEALSAAYRRQGWGSAVFTWHEGADLRVFRPAPDRQLQRDLVWVGNWGDDERAAELREFLVEPVAALGLVARVHGVRYPAAARAALAAAGIDYAGYLANFRVPHAFAEARMTVHIPRRPYARMLPGIPTIRMFEALACGIPLVSAPWEDCEHLFTPGEDYLAARDGTAMQRHLAALRADPALRANLAARGRATVVARHSCAHRVDELLGICALLGRDLAPPAMAAMAAIS